MTSKEANFTIKFNGDTGALVQDLQKLKGVVDKLDLSSTMKANFTKVFSDLEKSLGKVGDGFANGLKDNRSIAVFEQNLEQSGRLLDKLKQGLLSIPEDVIKKAFTADPQELKEITDQIDALNKKINDEALVAFGNLEKKLEALGKETKAHALGDFISHLKSGDIENAARDFKKLQTYFSRVTEGTNKYAVWQQAIYAIGKEFEKLLPSVTATEAEIGKLEARAEDLNETAGTEGKQSVDNIAHGLDDVKNSSQQAGQSFVETSKDANGLQKELDGFKNKVTYFFGLNNAVRLFQRALRSAFETVKDLDKVMTETAVVTEFSVGDMWTQLPEYTQRANELGVSIHDVYKASTLYYQQGLKTNEVMAVTNATLKMARIAGLEASEATDRMTNALRGFNMEITEANANNIADVYSKLAAITASNVDEISTAMTKTASLAASANMNFENTAAFLAQIIETTRESAETAGTALKTVIARFSEVKKLYSEGELLGTDAEGEAIDINKVSTALRTAGIDMNEFLTGAKGLDEVFIELASKWNSLTLVQQRYIATMAAGSRQQSRFIALMSDYQRTIQLTEAANNAAGASTKQYEKTLESFQTKVERLKNAYNEFVLGIANSSVIKAGIDLLTGILTKLNELTKGATKTGTSFKKLMLSIGLFSGAKAVLKGFEKNILGSIAQAFGKEGQNSGKSFIDGLKDSLSTAKSIFTKDFWAGGIGDVGLTQTTIDYTQKLTEALNSQDKTAKALGMTQQNIQALQQAGIPLSEQAVLLQNARTKGIMTSTEALDAESIAQVKQTQAELTEQGVIQKGIILKLAEKSYRLLNAIGIKVENTAIYKQIVAQRAANTELEKNIALQLASLGIIGLIIAALVALVAIIILVAKAIEDATPEARLKKTKDQIEKINEELTTSKTKLDNLKNAAEDLNNVNKGFEGLTKGTAEWGAQLTEANQKVLDLIEENPELAASLTIGENGQLTISETGLQNMIKTQTDEIIRLQNVQISLQSTSARTQAEIDINKIFEDAGVSKTGKSNYGGLNFNEFSVVAARLVNAGVTALDGINAEEEKIIQYTLNDLGYKIDATKFIERLKDLGGAFDEAAGIISSVNAASASGVITAGSNRGLTDRQLGLVQSVAPDVAQNLFELETRMRRNSSQSRTISDEELQALGVSIIHKKSSYGNQDLTTYKFNDREFYTLFDLFDDAETLAKLEEQYYDNFFEQIKNFESNLQRTNLDSAYNDFNNQLLDAIIEPLSIDEIKEKLSKAGLTDANVVSAVAAEIANNLNNAALLRSQLAQYIDTEGLTVNTAEVLADAFKAVPERFRQDFANKITNFLNGKNLTDEQRGQALKYIGNADINGLQTYLQAIGQEIDPTELAQFSIELGILNDKFKTKAIDQLINRFSDLEDTMKKLAEGTREYTDEEKQRLIDLGVATEQDFVATGKDTNYFKGDTQQLAQETATALILDAAARLSSMGQTYEFTDRLELQKGKNGESRLIEVPVKLTADPEEKAKLEQELIDESSRLGAMGVAPVEGTDLDAWDEGLRVLIQKDYPQLIGLVDELGTEEKRAAALVAISNEKARESFKNLTSAIQDNLEVLKDEYKGTDEYAAALASVTQYAKEAFGEDVTSEFISDNLEMFQDFANGVEGSTERIQMAILSAVYTTEGDIANIQAVINSINGAEFDIYGHADLSEIISELYSVGLTAEQVTNYLTSLEGRGFQLKPIFDEDGNMIGGRITNLGEQQRQTNFRSYGGGASKSSGGGSSSKAWENPYDELYNLTQKINTQLREREKLEKDYDRLLQRRSESVEEIKQKSLDILAALYRERDLNQQLLEGRRQQAAKILNQAYLDDDGTFKTFGQMGMAKYGSIDVNTGEVQINYDLIDSVTDAIEGARISAYISALEEAGKNIQDTTDEIEEIDDKIYEEQQRGKQDYLELEERTYQALVNQQQKVIDGYKTLSDAITDANQQIIGSLRESVEMERQIRDNTKKEEDIADKEARLAYLRRDTSGANDTEIMKLEKELGEAREQYADSLVDQAIADLEDQNEKASEQRQKQIDLMQSQLDYWATNGHYWKDVHDLISTGTTSDGLFNYSSKLATLLKGDANFAGMSVFGQEDWMQKMAQQYSSAMVGEMYWQKIDLDTGGDAGKKLGQIAEASKKIGTSTGSTGGSSPGTQSPQTPPETPKSWSDLSRDEQFEAIRHMTTADEKAISKLLSIELGELDLTNPIIFTKVFKLLNEGKYKLSKFASGGLVTSTGPAWLDGSLSSPEMVLNAKDTANLIQLKSILAQILSGGTIPGGGGDNYYNIDINVDELSSDYDVDKIAARIKQKIYDDSIYRNVNAINYIR